MRGKTGSLEGGRVTRRLADRSRAKSGADFRRFRLTEGVRPVLSAWTSRIPLADAANEGTPDSARECPRVTGVYEMDKTTARFAGSSSKPSNGLEPLTPSLP